MTKLDFGYWGQRLQGPHARSSPRSSTRRERGDVRQLLEKQRGACALCGPPIQVGGCEADHIVPVHQPFSARRRPCRHCAWSATPARPLSIARTGEPAVPSRPGDLRLLASTAAFGLRAFHVRFRQGLPRRGRRALPPECAGERPVPSVPSARLLPSGQHPPRREKEAGGSDGPRLAGLPGSGVGDHGADLAGGRGAHGQALCERSHRPLSSLQGRLLLHEDQRPRSRWTAGAASTSRSSSTTGGNPTTTTSTPRSSSATAP